MDNLGSIYIRKVFSLFMYVTPERRYCDVKSEREIFDLRNVVVVIIVTWLVVGKCTVCVFDVLALIDHVEWIKTSYVRVNFHWAHHALRHRNYVRPIYDKKLRDYYCKILQYRCKHSCHGRLYYSGSCSLSLINHVEWTKTCLM